MIFLFWLIHWLPQPVLAKLGQGLGRLAFFLARERRKVATINLTVCMPELTRSEIDKLVKRHFMALGRMATEWTILWWGSEARLRRTVRIQNLDRLTALKDTPVILLAPHFVGLDMCGVRLSMDMALCTMYTQQKSPLFTQLFLHGRMRFNPDNRPFSRQDGIRPLLKALKQNIPAYFLPDQDAGRSGALFVPFFGQPAATLTSLPRLAKAAHAVVIPAIPKQVKDGYILEL
ncbi:MAG: lipid A biosynthesis acyltransferase, partial [Pseudomonadota bacterium]|nr:lipid A biosynthesis acyltransferase [Pseudomonadota bacterium]